MTKEEIIGLITEVVTNTTNATSTEGLTQVKLTAITDAIAQTMTDTVNPTGPCYPSTPR